MWNRARPVFLVTAGLSLLLAGCVGTQRRSSSSLVQYLYPKGSAAEAPFDPQLSFPLRVGLAFVPEDGDPKAPRIGEKEKMDLLERVSAAFRKYPFVREVELIPTVYLRKEGGFENLEQLRSMYGTDVIALLSYDQVQHTDQGLASLTYWTIVGAYVVQGEKNDTSTLIDAAAYHVSSRKMLFRASGTSQVKGHATPVNLSEELREDSGTGLRLALDELVARLQEQLENLHARREEGEGSPGRAAAEPRAASGASR